ncbi:MAG: CotH kinase family protein [Bacillota bacterium]|nr:CotH kinase family protein [Bacillota bacterium]
MKYRILCGAAVILLLVIVIAAQQYEPDKNRYHQHLEEDAYTPCTDHGDDVFCTHLPLMNINTDEEIPDPYLYDENGEYLKNDKNKAVRNDETVSATVQFFDTENGNNHLTDEPSVQELAQVRIRGNSSRKFDKKGYLLKFTKENGIDSKEVSLAGMVKDSSWVLHGPILDKTLIRNYMCYNLCGTVMDYVPEVRFCEMFLNGEYIGVYLITEKINYNNKGRCNISKTDPDIASTSYILRMDTGDTDETHLMDTFFDYTGKRGQSLRKSEHFEIVYPSLTLTEDQKEYISYEISRLEKSLVSYDSTDSNLGYPAYIDVDSFAKFFVLNEFMMNVDAGALSTYFCKDVRGKIKIIGWDYNNAFDNFFSDISIYGDDFYIKNKWYKYILKDRNFVEKVIKTYRDLRKNILSDEYIINYIDETVEYLGPSIGRNYEKWGYTFSEEYNKENSGIVLYPLERNPSGYGEAVTQLKEAVAARGSFMDENIETLYAKCHDSVNKKYKLQSGE